jgi:peptidoglycan hydrolase-like protein with peptidoglycan-binding domain
MSANSGIVEVEVSITPAPSPVTSPTPLPSPTPMLISKGTTDSALVPGIQERLMELGYMDEDEPTDYFGPNTKLAVELFQRKHNLTIDGYVGEQTYELLMSDQATKYSVSIGAEGTDVHELQIRLRELGYINKATDYFGTETEAAVKKFQEKNGLAADGTVGQQTLELLYSEDAKANAISYGEKSDEVLSYQKRLAKLGYLTSEPDGNFGKDTVTAVKRFQERNGLIADGYVGPQTKQLLMSSDAEANALTIGASGRDVEEVQQRLKELNYLRKVTGYYGSDTEAAVRNFQNRNGLHVDGKVGKQTMSKLFSSGAKKASSSSGSSGSSSGSSGDTPPSGSEPSSPDSPAVTANVETFISIAESKLGSRYVRGGKGPNTFDCSGFVYWCLNQAGVKQGYMTSASWQKTTRYQRIGSMSDIRRGDVISFRGHVGIALGDGKMIDASSSQGQIRITNLSSSYWQRNFVCAYRIF